MVHFYQGSGAGRIEQLLRNSVYTRSFAASWRWNPKPNITNELVLGQNHYTFAFQQPADITKLTIIGRIDNIAQYD